MDKQELKDLIDSLIKTNNNSVSSTKTTGAMLKKVLYAMVNSFSDKGVDDSRYHTRFYGEIKLFWGNYFDLPKGWVICDGYRGTPDLRGKVPIGWSNGWGSSVGESNLSDYQQIGRVGGTKYNTLTKQNLPDYSLTHDLDVQAYSLNNKYVGGAGDGYPNGSGDRTLSIGGVNSYVRDTEVLSIPERPVVGTISLGGESKPLDNRSPYMVVMYIMYVGETVEPLDGKVTWAEYDPTTGSKIKEGSSNSRYGFRYIAPATFSIVSPDDYSTANNEAGTVVSNIGFIEATDPARAIEKWLQMISKGDNSGIDLNS